MSKLIGEAVARQFSPPNRAARRAMACATVAPPERAGWDAATWCPAPDISRALYYRLPPEQQPHSVKVGKRRIIRESPSDWLARMAAEQEAA